MRGWLAVRAGRLAGWISRKAGHGGSSLPGVVALRIDPTLLHRLAAQLSLGTVLVTGTNGKTTTAALSTQLLAAGGLRVGRNRAGANLVSGLVASFLVWKRESGRSPELALLETDEATIPRAARETAPLGLMVTNFFRDQLDRYGELSHTVSLVAEGLAHIRPGGFVLLNADDPQVAYLGNRVTSSLKTVYFGLDIPAVAEAAGNYDAMDARQCPRCGATLYYGVRHYAHLGDYQCQACGFERPACHVSVVDWNREAQTLTVQFPGARAVLPLRMPGIYNAYNLVAGAALAWNMGVPIDRMAAALNDFRPAFGRMESLDVNGHAVWIALVKNPVGFNQVLGAISLETLQPRSILLVINDRYADGQDVSWLWDVDFEGWWPKLAAQHWWVSGVRARDMAVRLKYAGVPMHQVSVVEDPARAAQAALSELQGTLYVLPTYTALLEVRRYFQEAGLVRHFREG